MSDMTIVIRTLALLEDLAKAGVIRVTINKPPPEHSQQAHVLPGIYALVMKQPKTSANQWESSPCDALWRTLDKHGGMRCGNGLGWNADKTAYWVQGQNQEEFLTGSYEWVGQPDKFRTWDSPELTSIFLEQ